MIRALPTLRTTCWSLAVVWLTAMTAGVVACDRTLDPVPVTAVYVTGPADSMEVGETLQLTATPVNDGDPVDGRPVEWSSDAPAVADVDSAGLVTGMGSGEATITATAEGVGGSAVLTVLVPVDDVVVDPPLAGVEAGATVPLSAMPLGGGETIPDRSVSWSSADADIATVDGEGVVTGVAMGQTVVTATAGGATGTAAIQVFLAPGDDAPFRYAVTFLGTAGTPGGSAFDINANGEVVGQYVAEDGSLRAFFWSGGERRDLGTVHGWSSVARAINDGGDVVGQAREGSCARALLWRGGDPIDLFDEPDQGCGFDDAVDINASGRIVGYSGAFGSPGFVWNEGTVTPLFSGGTSLTAEAVNDAGQILVTRMTGGNTHSGVLEGDALTWIPEGDRWNRARAINASGKVAGIAEWYAGGPTLVFTWHDGTLERLAAWQSGMLTQVVINAQGHVVAVDTSGDVPRPVLFREDAAYDLNAILIDGSWTITGVQALDDEGRIVGAGRNAATGEEGPILLQPVAAGME